MDQSARKPLWLITASIDDAVLKQAGTPVIGLTLRYDRLDNFRFGLCHELAHSKPAFRGMRIGKGEMKRPKRRCAQAFRRRLLRDVRAPSGSFTGGKPLPSSL